MSEVSASEDFTSITALIESARQRAYLAVNSTLIELYWQIGSALSRKIEGAKWGEGIVPRLAQHIAQTCPGLRGFTPRNLFRMRQFYETYRDAEIVTALLTQLPWTHHWMIMGQSQRPEEREFYIRQALLEKLSLAERALGRLDGITMLLPRQELFLYMYVRKKAILSSQIEGSQGVLETKAINCPSPHGRHYAKG